jgi:hypothetical protein
MPDVQTQLRVVPKRVAWMLAATIVILGIACIVTQVVRIRFNMRSVGLIAAFDMNREANVPTLFSTLLLLYIVRSVKGLGRLQIMSSVKRL